jgi:hypothetical protein
MFYSEYKEECEKALRRLNVAHRAVFEVFSAEPLSQGEKIHMLTKQELKLMRELYAAQTNYLGASEKYFGRDRKKAD